MVDIGCKNGRAFFIRILVIVVSITCGAAGLTQSQTIIDLRDFGVVAGSYHNAVEGIRAGLQKATQYDSAVVRFPKGRIDVWPEGAQKREYYISNATESDTLSKVKAVGVLLEHMSNVTLVGDSTIIFTHGKMIHLVLDHCRNIKVKGLAFDYERPTMSEFRVVETGDDYAVVRVHDDTRYQVRNGHVDWYGEGWKADELHVIRFDPRLNTMYYDRSKFIETSVATDLAERRIRFAGTDLDRSRWQKGDILTFRDPYRDCVGAFINHSDGIDLEGISLHYLHGLGIVSQFSRNIRINGLRAQPRKASGRIIAGFADFLHFSGCYGEVRVENSIFSGSHDDPINIHGTHLRVVESDPDKRKIAVRFMHHQTWNLIAFEPGDTIGFVNNNNLLVYAQAVVKQVSKRNQKELELSLDRALPSELGTQHCVENISKTPTVVIRNNRFERTNTRGLLVTTRRPVRIEDNVFYRTGTHAILIANDCNFWFESGPVRDVTIQRNRFIECGYNSFPESYPIAILPEVLQKEKGQYVHRNIRILNNEFILANNALLKAVATVGLVFEGNTVSTGVDCIAPPTSEPFIALEYCGDVQIHANQFAGDRGDTIIRLTGMRDGDVNLRANQGSINVVSRSTHH